MRSEFELKLLEVTFERAGSHPDVFDVVVDVVLVELTSREPGDHEIPMYFSFGPEQIPPDDPLWSESAYDEHRDRYMHKIMETVAEELSEGTGETYSGADLMRRLTINKPRLQ
jgi:hypothetical protein